MENIKTVLSVTVLILLSLLIIVPTASAESNNASRRMVANHYPDRFDRIGMINVTDKGGVVVNDMYVSFAPHVKFMTPNNERSSIQPFRPGQMVGYILNDQKQITELCLILEEDECSP